MMNKNTLLKVRAIKKTKTKLYRVLTLTRAVRRYFGRRLGSSTLAAGRHLRLSARSLVPVVPEHVEQLCRTTGKLVRKRIR